MTMMHYGRRECWPGHKGGPSIYGYYVFHYVYAGKGRLYSINDDDTAAKVYNVEAGQGFIINPGHRDYYIADDTDPWKYMWIGFNGTKAREYMKRTGLTNEQPIYSAGDIGEWKRMTDAMDYIVNNPSHSPTQLIGHLYLFIDALIHSCVHRLPDVNDSLWQFYVREAILFITRMYSQNITVQDIANHCTLHRSYLSRIFKSVLDLTPLEYLMRYRFDKACDLLTTSNHSVGEISTMVGYTNQLNFSRAFKRSKGMSPQQWKKIHT